MALDATGTPTAILSIPKYNTAVDPPSGKGFNAAMDFIDTIINAHTGVNSAGTTILGNKLLTADAQPAFRILGSGRLDWGAGGASAPDTTLYRSGVAGLYTEGSLAAVGYLMANANEATQITLADDGRVYFGSGADTNLYRNGVNELKTDDSLESAVELYALHGSGDQIGIGRVGPSSKPGILIQSDTNLYRNGASELKTDDILESGAEIYARHGGGETVALGAVGPSSKSGITFSNLLDTNLYRDSADVLATDDQFHIKSAAGLKFSDGTSQTTAAGGGFSMASGIINIFAGTAAPTGWLLCDGTSYATATYPNLFAEIGYTYGGAGANFNVPNLKGRVVVGIDSAQTEFDTEGETGGAKTHTLTTAELAVHSHGVTDPTHTHQSDNGQNAGAGDSNPLYNADATNQSATSTTSAASTGISIQNAGSGSAHNNLQPYMALSYIIKT